MRGFQSLRPNEVEISDTFQEGGYTIHIILGDPVCYLYDNPQFGGTPVFHGPFESIQEAIKVGESWT